MAVLVSDILPPGARRLAGTGARRAAPPAPRRRPLPTVAIGAEDVVIERAYLGSAYGAVTEAGVAAQRLLADAEGIDLETTYTAKAMAAMLDPPRAALYRGQPLLFWNTYSSVDPAAALPGLPGWRELPPAFHRFFAA
ncbi:MAG: hypothetical protein U0802_25935 [Candidatus Binatia bacterium]